MSKITVVNVVAVSYSGSTWANLVLGSAPGAMSVGEIDRAYKLGKAYCTLHGEECPVWSRFDLASRENPFVQIHAITGKRFLVVNNTSMFLNAQNHPDIDAKYVWLVRDGRAIVASSLRKYPGRSVYRATRDWARSLRKKQQLIASRPAGSTIQVRYCDMVKQPGENVKRICDFVGMDYDPGMLDYWNYEHHFMGGNGGPLTILAQQRNETLAPRPVHLYGDRQLPQADMEHYRQSDPRRFVDERWKTELSDWQLRLFEMFGGRYNRRFGYPPALERHEGTAPTAAARAG